MKRYCLHYLFVTVLLLLPISSVKSENFTKPINPQPGSEVPGMSDREKQQWSEFLKEEEVRKGGKEAINFVEDTFRIISTGEPHGDIAKAITKAFEDTVEETKRAGVNINDLSIAVGRYLENQAHAIGEIATNTEERILEGRFVDAIWHVAVDYISSTEEGFTEAVSSSTLLNNLATAAASIYGGYQGAAAYAAWFTYKQTADLQLAIKAGVIAGSTSHGLKVVNGIPSEPADSFVKKMLASATIGGAAVAASGGEEKEIIEAFVKGGLYPVARDYYENMTHEEIEGRAPTKKAITKLDEKVKHQYTLLYEESGNSVIDNTSVPKNISHVGIATADPNASFFSGEETSSLMQFIANLPYMNDMAYFHDQWVAISQMEGISVKFTIIPATMLTLTGSDMLLLNQLVDENTDNKKFQDNGELPVHPVINTVRPN